MQYITNSEKETFILARNFAQNFNNRIIALTGQLGAGKTIFAKGFAQGLGIKDNIISPTFVLIRQHQIPKTAKTLYHVDLYRLNKEVGHLGLEELFQDKDAIILIEWAEKLPKLPQGTIKIKIKVLGNNKRKLEIRN